MVSAVVAAFLGALACSGTPAVPQAVVAANIQTNGGMCQGQGGFWIPDSNPPNGPDPNVQPVVETNTGDVVISCSVIPSGSGGGPYTVNLVSQITGGLTPGTLTISGVFPARGRDAMGNPNADGTQIPNITGDFLQSTMHLRQAMTCFAQYDTIIDGQPATVSSNGLSPLPTVADTFADSNGGRIWASVFCTSPMNEDETMKPGNSGCEISVNFRFENCSSTASN
jgi:hypothetical protein